MWETMCIIAEDMRAVLSWYWRVIRRIAPWFGAAIVFLVISEGVWRLFR